MQLNSAVNTMFGQAAAVQHTRTMRQFAEDCIILPSGGPHEGRYFSCKVQPWAGLFFDAVDASIRRTGQVFYRTAATGPTQSGKTTTTLVIPICYHQFELKEDTTYGVPTLEMAGDKWRRDLFPIISASEFNQHLPTRGRGSRAGSAAFTGIEFGNGTALKMMPAGGDDKQVAGYTARVLAATEIDGYKRVSTSEEGSKVKQMEGRLRSHTVDRRRIYLECTVTVEEGAIWQEYINGSRSVILLPCPHCEKFVTPEREHFKGWQDAPDDKSAMQQGCFHCPECNAAWTEENRVTANRGAVLKHTNDSTTFSFRWSAVNNMFLSQSDIAYDEWHAARRVDRENAEREMCQFVWATPYIPPPPPDYITVETLEKAIHGYLRGIVPEWCELLTVGCDVGKHLTHYVAVAWRLDGTGHVVDYGRCEAPSREFGEPKGIPIALDTLHTIAKETGWQQKGTGKEMRRDIGAIDAGYNRDIVVNWCKATGGWWPAMGRGHTMSGFGIKRAYSQPKTKSKTVIELGDYWYVVKDAQNVLIMEHDVDFGKLWIQKKLQQPSDEPGAITLFLPTDVNEHLAFLKHLAAEQLIEENGEAKWTKISSSNHYLDAIVLAGAIARKHGVRVTPQELLSPPPTTKGDAPPVVVENGRTNTQMFRRRY